MSSIKLCSRVDPATTLREQDTALLGCHSVRFGVGAELGLERREMLHHECCQEPIFEREQILLVQRIDIGLRVLLDDTVGDDDGPSLVGSTDTIERETTGQTRY